MRMKASEKWNSTAGNGLDNCGLVQYLLKIIVLFIKRQHIMKINTLNKLNKRILAFFGICLVMAAISPRLAAQTIVNADFESGNTGFITDYSYTATGEVGEGHYCIDVTAQGHGGGTLGGWPNIPGFGGSGKYMLVNGHGGATNPTKIVWKQTVNVTANTDYLFSCQVVNLAQSFFGYSPNPAKLRLKINGSNVGADLTIAQNNEWHEWSNTWSSGSATQATIEIYDVYTGNSGLGDDFGLDHFQLTPQATYSVNAVDDDASVCLYSTVQIDVLDNDIITPSGQQAGATVQIIQNPQHGTATWNNNTRKIQYMFTDASYSGDLDQFKYRVTIPHGEMSEAWVYVTTSKQPNVGWIDPPATICAGGPLGIPVPTVVPAQGTGQWEYSPTQNGTYSPIPDPNNIPISMNGNYVRFSATNDCGTGSSNSVQISVTNGPTFTGQTPQVQPFCVGTNLTLTPPAFNANGAPIVEQGWVISQTENGEYQPFSLNNIPATYNGWYICYMVESSCGSIYSTPKRQLVVNVAPDVTGTLAAPEAICAGEDLSLNIPTYSGNGTGSWEICQTQNGTFQTFNPQNVPSTYNNWYIHYKVSNDCGSDVSNAVQIHVNDAPTIATPATPQAICAGYSFNLTTPTIQNNGSNVTSQGWQIYLNGSWQTLTNSNIPYSYNGCNIRYFAENDCDTTNSASVQVTVNDEPVVGAITAPSGICAGESFSLTAPTVDWRHTNQGTGSWEIAPTSSGEFTALNNNNIPFIYNGYYIRYKAVNGCGTAYSSNVVQVTVYSNAPTYDTITACDVYQWNGLNCNHTGDYQANVQSPEGCQIVAHLHFIMSDAYTETQTVSECGAYYWPKNGVTYNASGNYEYTVESGNPLVCDSIFTLNLTINNAPEILGSLAAPNAVCAGSALQVTAPQYAMNHANGGDAHWEYASSPNGPFTAFDPTTNNLGYGNYYLRFAVVNDCDEAYSNVVPFRVNDKPEVQGHLGAFQVCEGSPLDLPNVNVIWKNESGDMRIREWQMATTQNGGYEPFDSTMVMQSNFNGYWIKFVARNNCGEDFIGPVMITVLTVEDQWLETITACDAYTIPETGEVITQSQTVEYEVFEPCYHIVHQPVEINYSNHVTDSITWCHEEYVWNGMTFYHSDQTQFATITLSNQFGCDSVVDLKLDFDEYASYTHARTGCDSYVWEMKPDHTYTESAIDSVFVPAVGPDDCDTWYYLDLTLGHNTLIDGGERTECSGFVWHGVSYYEDAVIYDSLQTAITHCDSIIAYQLNIIAPSYGEESIVSCRPIWWQEHYCEEEGDYQHVFQTMQGCDSIVTMHFSLTPEIVKQLDTLACEAFSWYGNYFSENGQASHTFLTPAGCDSTVYLNVSFLQADILDDEPVSACNSYTFHGITYGPGIHEIYHDTVFAPNGCISEIQLLNLTVKDSEQMGTISGASSVYVASNLISGIYRYEIDMTGLTDSVSWSLSNSDWQIVESGSGFCRVLVTTPGTAILTARFQVEECGEMERTFVINAGFFDVEEMEGRQVQVYPNPTKGTVHIEAEGIESVRLTNMMGQLLEMREFGRADSLELNLSGYVPSVYLLEIKTAYGVVKRRVVVCR